MENTYLPQILSCPTSFQPWDWLNYTYTNTHVFTESLMNSWSWVPWYLWTCISVYVRHPHYFSIWMSLSSSKLGPSKTYCGHTRPYLNGRIKADAWSLVGEKNRRTREPCVVLFPCFDGVIHSLPEDLKSYQSLLWHWSSVQKQLSRTNLFHNATALLIYKLHW